MKKHPCPRCGRETYGSVSEGGAPWALCQDCMDVYFRREPIPAKGSKARDSLVKAGTGRFSPAPLNLLANMPTRVKY